MVTPMPEMNYTMISTTPSDENGMPKEPGAINGGMPKRSEPVKQTVVTIAVENIDNALLPRSRNSAGKPSPRKCPLEKWGLRHISKTLKGMSSASGNRPDKWGKTTPF